MPYYHITTTGSFFPITEESFPHLHEEGPNASSAAKPCRGLLLWELGRVKQLWRQATAIGTDSKAKLLREFVERILVEDPNEKILIFTEYADTLKYLRDTAFPEHDIAQMYGDLEQERRREMEKFEEEANLMLATDAAQEGLNLQFAHIMVNYDLPWNPIRIDQRMGRLHRYGQDRTVEIRNLFFDNTRESDILELLLEKTDQIEADLGMRSDVLGRILEDVDLDETIMAAIAEGRPTEEVVADIEATIEERKEALETVENDFLIRDRFDLSDEDREILDIIHRSHTLSATLLIRSRSGKSASRHISSVLSRGPI